MGIGFSTKVDALPIENTFVLISSCEKENIENHLDCSTTQNDIKLYFVKFLKTNCNLIHVPHI